MSKQTSDFYNRFSFFYPLADLFLKPQKRQLFREVNQLPSGELLEIGVGNGRHLSFYITHQITGIDTSLSMLQKARKQKRARIKLLQMDGESLLFPDQSFDYVILSHVVAVVDNPERLLEETFRTLRPDGKLFILNHFTPDNWLRHIDHSFQAVSTFFHFRSVFYIDDLFTLKKFRLLKEIRFGKLSYFKLLIYQKV